MHSFWCFLFFSTLFFWLLFFFAPSYKFTVSTSEKLRIWKAKIIFFEFIVQAKTGLTSFICSFFFQQTFGLWGIIKSTTVQVVRCSLGGLISLRSQFFYITSINIDISWKLFKQKLFLITVWMKKVVYFPYETKSKAFTVSVKIVFSISRKTGVFGNREAF